MSLIADQPTDLAAEVEEIKGRSLLQDAKRRFYRNKAAVASLFILLLVGAFVIFVPMLAPFGYAETDWNFMQSAPAIDNKHYFGTDSLGRDLLVRTAVGGRISLMVGVAGATVAVIFGTIYGAPAASCFQCAAPSPARRRTQSAMPSIKPPGQVPPALH